MKKSLKIAVSSMALLLPTVGNAAETTNDEILKHLTALEAEIASLHAELAKNQSQAAVVAEVSTKSAAVENKSPSKNWTGGYFGAQIGRDSGSYSDALKCGDATVGSVSAYAGLGIASTCDAAIVAVTGFAAQGLGWQSQSGIGETSGYSAGLRAGYNYQFDQYIIGAETSLSYSGAEGGGAIQLSDYYSFDGYTYQVSHNVDWYGRTVAKLGYAISNDLMLSVDGGLAIAKTTLTSSAGYTSDSLDTGWTAGVEAEYRLSENVGLTASYSHMAFSDVDYEGSSEFGMIDNYHNYDLNLNNLSVGLNYHF